MPTWNTDTDFDAEQDNSGFVHDSLGDHPGNGTLAAGYLYSGLSHDLNTDGLVGWWPLHEWNGRANDLSGFGNHGSVNGPTQGVAGRGGLTAYSFDGSDGSVDDINNDNNLSIDFVSNGVTFCAWVRANSLDTNESIIHINDQNANWGFRISNQKVALWHGSSGNNSNGEGTTTLPTDEWKFIVATYDDSSDEMEFFIDGSSDGTFDTSDDGEPNDHQFGSNEIGSRSGDRYFDGVISDARVYERILSASEISTLYEWGSANLARPPDDSDGGVSYYDFNSSNANDQWGSNDGTVNGLFHQPDSGPRGDGAYRFDNDGNIVIGSLGSLPTYTACAWVRPDDQSGTENIINVVDGTFIDLRQENGNWKAILYDGSPQAATGSSVLIDTWIHLAARWNGSEIELWENGTLAATQSAGSFNDMSGSGYIGSSISGTNYFNGIIDEVRFYDRPLDPWEISQLYRFGTLGRDMRKMTVNA